MSYDDQRVNLSRSSYVPQALPKAPLNDSEPFNSRQRNSLSLNLEDNLNSESKRQSVMSSNSRLRRKPPPDISNEPLGEFNDVISELEQELNKFDFDDNNPLDFESQADYYSNSESLDSPQQASVPSLGPTSGLNLNKGTSLSDNFVIHTPELTASPQLQPDYNTDYSHSSTSPLRSINQVNAPYPLDSPIAPSTSSLSYNEGYGTSSNGNSPAFPISNGSFDESPTQFPVSPNTFNRTGSQTTTSTNKSYQLKPTISTPITNILQFNNSNNDQFRPNISNPPSTNILNSSSLFNSSMSNTFQKGHRKSSSLSSILSSTSQKNVNLATLKKTMNLKPGEGERSMYVSTLRKNSGTAYNETGPGKWKLPIGIAPIDKRATYTTSNSKYMRMVGGVSQTKVKRGTGVELKHGHLAPRLLAAEVDDGDDISMKFNASSSDSKELIKSKAEGSSTTTLTEESNTPQNRSSMSSSIIGGGGNSSLDTKNGLTRITTDTSAVSAITSTQSKSSPSKRSSISSNSSGSISDVNGFYQHPLYNRYIDDDDDDEHLENDEYAESEFNHADMENDCKDTPRLVLANPDASDSD